MASIEVKAQTPKLIFRAKISGTEAAKRLVIHACGNLGIRQPPI
jgi:hypothetical protein